MNGARVYTRELHTNVGVPFIPRLSAFISLNSFVPLKSAAWTISEEAALRTQPTKPPRHHKANRGCT